MLASSAVTGGQARPGPAEKPYIRARYAAAVNARAPMAAESGHGEWSLSRRPAPRRPAPVPHGTAVDNSK